MMVKDLVLKTRIGKYLKLKKKYVKLNMLKKLSDEEYVKELYLKHTGRVLNLDNPRTFNEKLTWLKLYYRNPIMIQCTDKYLVRDYVKSCGLDFILNEIYDVYNDARDIDFSNLPDRFFLKCNHTSGDNILYDRNKPFNKSEFTMVFNFMLKQNYYLISREWNYKDIVPKIIAEKVYEEKEIVDYRFLCFNGVVKLVMVDIDTCTDDGRHDPNAKRNIYDENFNYLNFSIGREGYDLNLLSKPKSFETMKEYAERLSKPFPFVRVDLYNFDGEIYFGEMTFFPAGCLQSVSDEQWDLKIGSWIDLDKLI